MGGKSSTNRIEKRIALKAPVARVWRAVTDHREFNQWFRVKLERPFEVGKETSGYITHPGYEHMLMRLVVEAMEPPRRFAFRWHPYEVDPKLAFEASPTTLVEFLLQETPTGTLLELTESGFDALPAEQRAAAYRSNEQGWSEQVRNIEAHVRPAP